MNDQHYLAYLTREELKGMTLPHLRGISAYWENNTVKFKFLL